MVIWAASGVPKVVAGVCEVCGPERVAVRLSPNGVFNDMGSPDYRETFTYVARQLDTYGLAYLHVMDGLAFGFHELGEPMTLAEFRELTGTPRGSRCCFPGGRRSPSTRCTWSGETGTWSSSVSRAMR